MTTTKPANIVAASSICLAALAVRSISQVKAKGRNNIQLGRTSVAAPANTPEEVQAGIRYVADYSTPWAPREA